MGRLDAPGRQVLKRDGVVRELGDFFLQLYVLVLQLLHQGCIAVPAPVMEGRQFRGLARNCVGHGAAGPGVLKAVDDVVQPVVLFLQREWYNVASAQISIVSLSLWTCSLLFLSVTSKIWTGLPSEELQQALRKS